MKAVLREWISRLAGVFGRGRNDQDLEQELQLHLELVEQDLRLKGMSPQEAARQARLRIGLPAQTMQALRERRGFPPLSTFWLDTKLGLRMLRKHWGLTLIGGLTLAAAMTTGAAVFNLLNALEGSTLPLEEGNRVVIIQPFDLEKRQQQSSSREDYERWRSELRSVENVSAFHTVQRSLAVEGGPPTVISVAQMSGSGFRLARVTPLLGRFLIPEDESKASAPVIVIGYNAWQAKFAANPAVLGRQVRLDGVSHTIVGVMPQRFRFPVNHQYWTSLKPNTPDRVIVFARLAPGTSVEGANAEIQTMGLVNVKSTTGANPRLHPRLVPYVAGIELSNNPGGAITAILPFVLPLLLLPPCANLAILIYARMVARQGEFAARSALGASRGRIVAQILIEVLLLAVGAAGVALLLAPKVGLVLQSLFAIGDPPFWMNFDLSYQTIFFAGGLAVIAAMLAGGVPAFRVTGRWKLSGIHALRGSSNPRLGKVWTFIVVTQIALSVAAVPTIAEVAWTTMRPAVLGPGFNAGDFLTARLAMNRRAGSRTDDGRFSNVRTEVVRQLESESGVTAVTMSQAVPFEESDVLIETDAAGAGGRVQKGPKSVALNHVAPSFFETLGVPLLTGRRLGSGDAPSTGGSVVVNQSFSRKILGNSNPLGRRIRVVGESNGKPSVITAEYEIVGVVGDLFAASRMPTMYRPLSANSVADEVRLTLRTGASMQHKVANRLREITASIDPAVHVDDIQPLDEVYRLLSISSLAGGGIVAALTLCGILFSVAGIYTSMAFTVVQRRREIGIRSALGAPSWNLVAGVFRQVLLPVGVGVGLGGAAAMLIDYHLSPLLFDLGTEERPLPWMLPAAELFIFLIAAVALYGPVRHALRIDPMEAVRES
jgi:putative ABC transport system permease protein